MVSRGFNIYRSTGLLCSGVAFRPKVRRTYRLYACMYVCMYVCMYEGTKPLVGCEA